MYAVGRECSLVVGSAVSRLRVQGRAKMCATSGATAVKTQRNTLRMSAELRVSSSRRGRNTVR